MIQYTYHGDTDAFRAAAGQLADTIADLDGFVAKLWLDDDRTGAAPARLGGVDVWRDRLAADAYEAGELFPAAISGNPDVGDLTIERCDLWAAPTAVTNGGLPVARWAPQPSG